MFKRLFCKHKYKYYNTRVEYPAFGVYGYNVFQFVCTDCGKITEVNQLEIDDSINKAKEFYNRSIALGGERIKSSKFSIRRHNNIGVCYDSPAATLVIESYLNNRGIDLMQLDY